MSHRWRLKTWECQERLLCKSKPRCLWLSTSWSCMFLKIKGGCSPRLLDVIKAFVFWALKLSPQVSDHVANVMRSSDKSRCKWLGNLDEKYKVVSSANKETDDWILSDILLICIRKRRGPRTESWVSIALFRGASIAMYHLRPIFQIRSKVSKESIIPICLSLKSKFVWTTLSKALEISRNTIREDRLWSWAEQISQVVFKSEVRVECFFTKLRISVIKKIVGFKIGVQMLLDKLFEHYR